MKGLLYIFGVEDKTKSKKEIIIRKRFFHRGYQISSIERGCIDCEDYNDSYSLLVEVRTFEEVLAYIEEN